MYRPLHNPSGQKRHAPRELQLHICALRDTSHASITLSVAVLIDPRVASQSSFAFLSMFVPRYAKSAASAATALAAGSLALIKQSNPKLPWHDVLKISKQTILLSRENIKKLHDNLGVLQVYDAALLAKFGAKISVHVEEPHDGNIYITLLNDHHKFKTTSMGFAEFFLNEGNHKIAISAKGFAPKVQEIKVKPTRNQTLRIKLEKSEIKNAAVRVKKHIKILVLCNKLIW